MGVATTLELGGVDFSSCYSRTSVARVLTFRDHRIEFLMGQPTIISEDAPTAFDHHLAAFPTRHAGSVPAALPAQSGRRLPTAPPARVRQHAIRQVVIFEVAGRLSDLVQELNEAIQRALAGGPRGVVCDLSGVLEGTELASLELLATAGRHVRDWPGIPVVVASPDPQVREELHAHPLGAHLIVTESLFTAITAVLSNPTLDVQRLQLHPHPTAPRAARDYVTRTLLDWQLSRVIPFANLVVSELVASSSIHARTDIDLSVAWDRGALRLTVADHAPALPGHSHSNPHLHGRTRTVLAGLTRVFGVLPAADGGKVVWAVLEAPRQNPSTSNGMRAPTRVPQKRVGAKAIGIALDALASVPSSPGCGQNPELTTGFAVQGAQ